MPTSNPVPSNDPSDLLHNAGLLDRAMNAPGLSFTDRLGNTRKTYTGFENEMEDHVDAVDASRVSSQASMTVDVNAVDASRISSQASMAADVDAVDASRISSQASMTVDLDAVDASRVTAQASMATEVSLVAAAAADAIANDIPAAVATVAAINNRGAWITATAYTYMDIVLVSGTWYLCVVPHTSSAAFATDGATKWRVYQGVIAADLANATDNTKGAAIVGYDNGTVADRIKHTKSSLPNWFRGSLSGKKMAWVGDSTTYLMSTVSQNLAYLVNNYQSAGGPLAGVTLQWFGANGNTLSNFVNDTGPAGTNLSDVIAAAPDIVIWGYGGINDVRLGLTSQAQLLALEKFGINRLRAALPNTDIVYRGPNSLLTTDVGGFGYITSTGLFAGMTLAQAAQAATDIMRGVCRSLKDYWPNVLALDFMDDLFPGTCVPTSALMNDALHPTTASGVPPASVGGFAKIFDRVVEATGVAPSQSWLTQYVGQASRYNQASAVDAVAASYADAHLTYARVVENGDYELIASGAWVLQGSGFLRFSGDQAQIGNIAPGDIVVQDGVTAFTLPSGASVSASGANIQLGSLGAGVPTYAQTGGIVSVWRHKYCKNVSNKPYVKDTAYPYKQRFLISTGGANFIRLQAMPNGKDPHSFNFAAGDFLLHPDAGPIALSSATYAFNAAGVIQITVTGTFTLVSGHNQCMVVGQGQNGQRAASSAPNPIRFTKESLALVTGAGSQVMSRGGYYSRMYGKLSTALTSTVTTVLVKKAGATVATLTFAAGNATATVSYASGSGFTVLPGDVMTYDVTAIGTGTADMSIVFDA